MAVGGASTFPLSRKRMPTCDWQFCTDQSMSGFWRASFRLAFQRQDYLFGSSVGGRTFRGAVDADGRSDEREKKMCDSGTNDQKVIAYKVTMGEGSNELYTRSLDFIEMELDGAEIGEKLEIEVVQVTEQFLMDLPEFEGF
jgi:hypothetical protein